MNNIKIVQHIQHTNERDKKICESIKLYNSQFNRCFLTNDKTCESKTKLCSEYLGQEELECKKYRALDTVKNECAFENKKCIEKLKPIVYDNNYKYCSDYRGTDRNLCESILPHVINSESEIDYSSKCVFGNAGCERVSKICEEEKDERLCSYIDTNNENTNCVFKNNKCVEQYKTCESYETNGQPINKETCESIFLTNSLIKKCVYNEQEGANNSINKTCVEERKSCSDFNELQKLLCRAITPTDITKKCIFSNNACSTVAKTCLELVSGVTSAEQCKAAATSSSSYKECVLKSGGGSCEEKFKTQEVEIRNEEGGKNEEEKKPEESFGGKKYFNNLIYILLCFLVSIIVYQYV